MTRTALVLDSGSGASLATIRSLGRRGWFVVVVSGTRAERSKYAAVTVPVPDAADDVEGFGRAVVEAVHEHSVDVVAPATDAAVEGLWLVADSLGAARILGGDRAGALLATEKGRSLAAADRHGFPTPPWIAPETAEDAAAALEVTGLPAVVKPHRSYVREGARLRQRRHEFVHAANELAPALQRLRGADGRLPLVQAFVRGRSISTTVVLRAGRVLALVARETMSFEPVGGGTSVWKRTIPPDGPGVQEAVAFLQAVGYEGLAEVEYQVGDDGVPRLMEIGARLHGWVPLAVHAGVDLPLIAAQALLGDELDGPTPYRVGAEMRWPSGELGRLRTALSRDPQLPPGVSRLDVLAKAWPPWRPGMAYDGIVLDDPGPWRPTFRRRRVRPAAR